MTSTVLRCETAADLIAVIPRLTGFTDQNSLFLVLFQGKRGNRVLRFTLPPAQTPTDSETLAEGIVSLLRESGAGAAAPAAVIHTALSFSEQQLPPWQHLTAQLQLRMRREGWRLREFALVAADGWCELLGEHAGQQRPLSELDKSRYARRPDSNEQSPLQPGTTSTSARAITLTALGAAQPPTPDRALAVARHLRTLRRNAAQRQLADAADLPGIRRIARAADACFHAVNGTVAGVIGETLPDSSESEASAEAKSHAAARPVSLGSEPESSIARGPGAAELARLIHAAQSGGSWLVIALTALTRAEFVASVTAEIGARRLSELDLLDDQHTEPGSLVDWTAEALLRSLADELPERGRLLCAIEVFRDAAAHAPESCRPAVLALLAWAWWLLGLQSVAASVLKQARECLAMHPGHNDDDAELVELVTRLVAAPPAAHLNQLKQQFAATDTPQAA